MYAGPKGKFIVRPRDKLLRIDKEAISKQNSTDSIKLDRSTSAKEKLDMTFTK